MTLIYLFLVLTFSDGTQSLEAVGATGPTYDDCVKVAAYLQYQNPPQRPKPIIKIETQCRSGIKP